MGNVAKALVVALLLASTTGHKGGPRYDLHPFGKACIPCDFKKQDCPRELRCHDFDHGPHSSKGGVCLPP